jgi:hypothetical protein
MNFFYLFKKIPHILLKIFFIGNIIRVRSLVKTIKEHRGFSILLFADEINISTISSALLFGNNSIIFEKKILKNMRNTRNIELFIALMISNVSKNNKRSLVSLRTKKLNTQASL